MFRCCFMLLCLIFYAFQCYKVVSNEKERIFLVVKGCLLYHTTLYTMKAHNFSPPFLFSCSFFSLTVRFNYIQYIMWLHRKLFCMVNVKIIEIAKRSGILQSKWRHQRVVKKSHKYHDALNDMYMYLI